MIIDAKGHVLGRLATYVAKNALLGEDIIIVNSEKIMISGKKKVILKREAERLETRNKGNPQKGPYHQKRPDKFVRRTIRGMLPWKRARGFLLRIVVFCKAASGNRRVATPERRDKPFGSFDVVRSSRRTQRSKRISATSEPRIEEEIPHRITFYGR